jgi:hypothetical protein
VHGNSNQTKISRQGLVLPLLFFCCALDQIQSIQVLNSIHSAPSGIPSFLCMATPTKPKFPAKGLCCLCYSTAAHQIRLNPFKFQIRSILLHLAYLLFCAWQLRPNQHYWARACAAFVIFLLRTSQIRFRQTGATVPLLWPACPHTSHTKCNVVYSCDM